MRVQDLAPLAVTFVTAGVTLGIGAQILDNTGEGMSTVSVINESTTFANNTPTNLRVPYLQGVTGISNNSVILTSGNWTTDTGDVSVEFTLGNNPGVWNVTYSGWNSTGYLSIINSTGGIAELSSWMDTIGLVLAASVIIGVIFNSFGRLSR